MAPKREGKKEALKVDPLNPTVCQSDSSKKQINIEQKLCGLFVEKTPISGTELYNCSSDTGPCVALLKSVDEANLVYGILTRCDHPNILKPLGVWKCPTDETKAYLVFEKVNGPLITKGKEYMFSMEGESIYGFSASGFVCFRAIFSAIDYVNNLYKKDISSSATEGFIPLLPLRLSKSTVFYVIESFSGTHEEVQILLGDFMKSYPNLLLNQNKVEEPTIDMVIQLNWKKAGEYLETFYGKNAKKNGELKALQTFLTCGTVRYNDLLWQPGIWEANVKMEFIREVYWIIDRERDLNKTQSLESTEKGNALHRIQRPLHIKSCVEKFTKEEIKETSLLHSLKHLRDKLLGHYDDSFEFYKGPKSEIGTDKVILERFLQKSCPDYMIKLSMEIRELKWITESPVLRGENDYMSMFYEMEKKKDRNNLEKSHAPKRG